MSVRLLPGFGYVQETASAVRLLPGFGYVQETQAPAAVAALCLSAGALQYKVPAPGERSVYLNTSGGLVASASPVAGARLMRLTGGALTAA